MISCGDRLVIFNGCNINDYYSFSIDDGIENV